MWTKTADGSVVDRDGRVIFFSTDRFVKDICLGDCCFICGADPAVKPFNDEHVIPEWILRRFNLFAREIVLPNGNSVRYDRYKVPCCADCNATMGREFEGPISELFQGGSDAVDEFVRKDGPMLLFIWMGLIFLKTHLKDRAHRVHLDARKGTEMIADEYDWELLHHIHTVVRSFYVGSRIQRRVIGSFMVLPARQATSPERFDFGDLNVAQTMLVRLDDVALVAVFNDACGALNYFAPRVERFTGPLAEPQLREVMTDMAYLNLRIKERPTFESEVDLLREAHDIKVTLPSLELQEAPLELRGRLLENALRRVIPHIVVPGHSADEVLADIKAGTFTTLFDRSGNFIADGPSPTSVDRPYPSD